MPGAGLARAWCGPLSQGRRRRFHCSSDSCATHRIALTQRRLQETGQRAAEAPPSSLPPGHSQVGVGQNFTTQVLVLGSIYQGSTLGTYFDPQLSHGFCNLAKLSNPWNVVSGSKRGHHCKKQKQQQHHHLGLGAVLARAQGHNGVGPAVECLASGTSLMLRTKGRPLAKSASHSSKWKARSCPRLLVP